MASRADQIAQLCGHIRALSRSNHVERVQEELKLILESDQFRTSHRSCIFLQHVVDKALCGSFDALKERVVGIELFGRDSSFDTDHDSVVRVAANDVRKRLREYYRKRSQSKVRIALPAGVYIPQIEIEPEISPSPFPPSSGAADVLPAAAPVAETQLTSPRSNARRYAFMALLAGVALTAIAVLSMYRRQVVPSPRSIQPWAAVFESGKPVNLVPADANLVMNKVRSGRDVPIETYATRGFAYAGNLSGPFGAFINEIPLTTVCDAILASRIAELAAKAGTGVRVRYSSRFDFSELKNDEPLVLFGSPMSNPWVQMFNDQLNFQVVHRFDSGMDVCINRHPKPGEPPAYVPNRNHEGFSEAYALVALEPNLGARAPVLIIAGTSTEGTEAAGEFVTNLDRLSAALRKLGIRPGARLQRLELVIKSSYVPAASARSEVVAYRAQ